MDEEVGQALTGGAGMIVRQETMADVEDTAAADTIRLEEVGMTDIAVDGMNHRHLREEDGMTIEVMDGIIEMAAGGEDLLLRPRLRKDEADAAMYFLRLL